jgi:dihydroorotase-like cyclic amidohydrolase
LAHTVDAASLASKSHNSPFVGKAYRGGVMMSMAQGRIVYARDIEQVHHD